MAELLADLFVSVDGFAAGEDVGPFFGYHGPDLEAWITTESERAHTLLMGRVTFELMAGMSAAATDPASLRMTALPKVVVSGRLREPLDWANSRVLSGDLAEGIAALKRDSTGPVRTIGSLTLVRSLLTLGLVDQLRLMVFPLTLGTDGREPAYLRYPRAGMRLAGTTVLDDRLVLLTYRP
ncbi:dihydrofolate reductase family protein [Cryptosporangium aurantiacum]|uniref:Dihydrofolate reductase n=1 Tax=Cryptosporangium aurantiacum TaxID=134849 RepID=A0A1M7RLC7_9ACTN|nr:dihydrofolate reductase family protein [Cryptosporangium aurantiacum]SHN46979.1 Dihydrofolate reductase [Cryptosporangium aurantiacum]